MIDLSKNRDRNFIGIVILIFGIVLLLNNVGVLNIKFGTIWLPLLLILIGVWSAVSGSHKRTIGPFIFVGLGLLWLFHNTGWLDWKIFWPLLIILSGIWLLLKKSIPNPFKRRSSSKDDVNLFTLFGGSEIQVESKSFRGGNAFALFGGIDLDLRNADLADGESPQGVLDVAAIFGGIDIRVPQEWSIILRGTPILGGIEDARKKSSPVDTESPPTLLIHAFALFGGIEVGQDVHLQEKVGRYTPLYGARADPDGKGRRADRYLFLRSDPFRDVHDAAPLHRVEQRLHLGEASQGGPYHHEVSRGYDVV